MSLLDSKNIAYGAYSETNWFTDILFHGFCQYLFSLVFGCFWQVVCKNMGSSILGIGSSKKLVNSEKPKVKFSDVAGVEEAKEEVKEIVDF